jgi:hypothetical protein
MPEFLGHYWLRCPDFVGIDTYCNECTVYYHQLMTYGQPVHEPEGSIVMTPGSVQETGPTGTRESRRLSKIEPIPS